MSLTDASPDLANGMVRAVRSALTCHNYKAGISNLKGGLMMKKLIIRSTLLVSIKSALTFRSIKWEA